MREFFGTVNLIKDGEWLHSVPTNTIHMNPRTYAQLKLATKETT